ncbi:MAG: DUF2807 domain-containing protein [Anaerolineae bacterium]|nr:DUF2807 domain-containing protein [Anaerolineae bacterium]MCA9896286.1 DUF2807 domain-containing protein [Anaerolineae bacterium]MCB9458763.1 DUF2807 domain-containing protein [Anaerolineaceae bacterium]
MRQISILLSIILALIGLSACTTQAVIGSGEIVTETRDVSAFTGVRLADTGEVTITVGEPQAITVTAYENLLPLLKTTVEDNVLVIELAASDSSYITDTQIEYTISVPSLDYINLGGTGNITIHNLDTENFVADIPGPGNLTADGTVTEQTIDINGLGSYYGFDVISETTTIMLGGPGIAEVYATGTLNATIIGKEDIVYKGDPVVHERIEGIGEVVPYTEDE